MKTTSTMHPQLIKLTAILTLIFCSLEIFASKKTLIFPIPQKMEVTTDIFTMDETVSIIVPLKTAEKDLSLARSMIRELSDKYSIALKIETRSDIPKGRKIVVMGSLNNPLIKKYCMDNKLVLTEKDPGAEGYILHVNNNLILIAGSDDAGAFYGFQSLRQLIQAGNGKSIQGVKQDTWLKTQGVRLKEGRPSSSLMHF